VERLVALGLVPTGSSPEHLADTVAGDITRFGRIAARIGLEPQ
jgi:hypothetical protein